MMGPDGTQQAMEQAAAGLSSIATILGEYRKKLQKEGLTRGEAMTLVTEYQRVLFGQIGKQGGDKE